MGCLCCNLWMATQNAMTWCHCRVKSSSRDHKPGLAICPKHVGCHLRRELFPETAINLSSGAENLMNSHASKQTNKQTNKQTSTHDAWEKLSICCSLVPYVHSGIQHRTFVVCVRLWPHWLCKQQCSWRSLRRALHGKHPKLHKPRPDSRPWKGCKCPQRKQSLSWRPPWTETLRIGWRIDKRANCSGSGFSVPGMVFSLPEVLFSRIWVFSSHGVSCSRWCFQFPPPWVCGSHCGVFRYHVGV